jgi:hypothetical protein
MADGPSSPMMIVSAIEAQSATVATQPGTRRISEVTRKFQHTGPR